MNTTFRPRPIPSRPEELAMSLVCRWGGVSVEMGLGERILDRMRDFVSTFVEVMVGVKIQFRLCAALWLVYKLRDQVLFDKAYAYIKEYY